MSRYAITTFVENDRNDGSLVLGRFGEYVVVDQSIYDNVQTDEWHRAQAEDYRQWLDDQEAAALSAKSAGAV